MNTVKNYKAIHLHYWGNTHNAVDQVKKIPFRPPKLPYSYSALDKIADTANLKNHFLNYHMRGFEDFLDLINETEAESMGINQIFKKENQFDNGLIEAACVVYNHQMYWDNLCPYSGEISHDLELAINKAFGSVYRLKEQFIEIGMKNSCCGWLWMIVNQKNELQVISTIKNENPLQKHAVVRGNPVLAIDLWEHAFFGKFSNDKRAYLNAIWSIINWSEVSHRYRFTL